MVRNALVTFATCLMRCIIVINPLQPIAAGVLDTSGSDSLWTKMVAKDGVVVCLSHPPESYFHSNVHHSIRLMCQKLVDRKKAAHSCSDGKRFLIDSIKTPKGLTDEPER